MNCNIRLHFASILVKFDIVCLLFSFKIQAVDASTTKHDLRHLNHGH